MTNLGRVIVTIVAVAVLVTAVVLAVQYLRAPEPERPKPTIVETPAGDSESLAADARPESKEPPGGRQEPSRPSPGTSQAPGPGDALADEGLELFRRGRLIEAQRRLSDAVRAGLGRPKGRAVCEALANCADRIQFAPRVVAGDPYSKTYAVVSGDTLSGIGGKFLVPYKLIMKLNRFGSTRIYAGQVLKVLQGPVHIEIIEGRRELRAWLGEVCLRVYPIGVGVEDTTPQGTFIVERKITDPPYQPQHKQPHEFRPAGHPENPLGTRWIDIGNHYGIHGTNDPPSIGRAVSEGCIRMHNAAVEELYDLVVQGASKVVVRP